ncbi:hypothetical protein D3C87_2000570 [compost metagenome]
MTIAQDAEDLAGQGLVEQFVGLVQVERVIRGHGPLVDGLAGVASNLLDVIQRGLRHERRRLDIRLRRLRLIGRLLLHDTTSYRWRSVRQSDPVTYRRTG